MDFGLYQNAIYWGPNNPDGFGQVDFSSPVVILCRWEEKQVQFRDTQGTLLVSHAVVYLDQPVEIGGWIVLQEVAETGAGSHPRDFGASEVRHIGTSPSLHADQKLYKVML